MKNIKKYISKKSPGYELPGVLRDPLMTVAPINQFDNFTCGRIDLMGDIVTK